MKTNIKVNQVLSVQILWGDAKYAKRIEDALKQNMASESHAIIKYISTSIPESVSKFSLMVTVHRMIER